MVVGKSGEQGFNPHYGGDRIKEGDDESHKLYINDCRKRQTSMYPASTFKSPSVRMLLHAHEPCELLVMSGQSRLHLSMQLSSYPTTTPNTDHDWSIFPCKEQEFPHFPYDLEEETVVFRSHGLPLLVWPKTRDHSEIVKYLEEHYPDCAYWFSELIKVNAWLQQKWIPLSKLAGISADSEQQSTSQAESAPVTGFPRDSVAIQYITRRLHDYQEYASLLQEYLMHRRRFTTAFSFNPIHNKLQKLYKSRLLEVHNDSGFLNVVGNRLLQMAIEAEQDGIPMHLNIPTFARGAQDSKLKEQCLQSLLSAKALRKRLHKMQSKTNTKKEKNISKMDMDDEFSDLSDESDEDPAGEAPTGDQMDGQQYQSRPITKDIMDNRGLVKYRHKRERNPRVHLRYKYRKATIRYRSRAPPVRHEETPYAGEVRGIRAHLIKSHKFKRTK